MSVHLAKTQISLGIWPVWSVFAVHIKKAWVLSYPSSAQRRLWSVWADAQADLSLRWAHSHIVGFVMSWLSLVPLIVTMKQPEHAQIWILKLPPEPFAKLYKILFIACSRCPFLDKPFVYLTSSQNWGPLRGLSEQRHLFQGNKGTRLKSREQGSARAIWGNMEQVLGSMGRLH